MSKDLWLGAQPWQLRFANVLAQLPNSNTPDAFLLGSNSHAHHRGDLIDPRASDNSATPRVDSNPAIILRQNEG